MQKLAVVAALSVAVTSFAAKDAEAVQIVTGGSATFEITTDLGALSLGTNAAANADGNPEVTGTVRGDPRSQVIPGGALLSVRGSLYLYPTDTTGAEVESFANVKTFNFFDDNPLVTDEMKLINYVPTADPNVFTDLFDPSASYSLTDEQVALLQDGQRRTCCAHTLGGFEINTADMTVDGVIDNIAERDINFDGVIDENDEFYLFDMLATSDDSVFDLALTETLAQYLNFGFTPAAFFDGQTLANGWAALQPGGSGFLNFSAGDIIGNVSYSYETQVAPIPVPASLPLLAAGLGLMGLLGVRRKRAA